MYFSVVTERGGPPLFSLTLRSNSPLPETNAGVLSKKKAADWLLLPSIKVTCSPALIYAVCVIC